MAPFVWGGILSKVKNIPIIERKDIMKYKFDYIIISSIIHSGDIYREALSYGVPSESIIDGLIFTSKDFDFEQYYQDNKLHSDIIGNIFQVPKSSGR